MASSVLVIQMSKKKKETYQRELADVDVCFTQMLKPCVSLATFGDIDRATMNDIPRMLRDGPTDTFACRCRDSLYDGQHLVYAQELVHMMFDVVREFAAVAENLARHPRQKKHVQCHAYSC